MYDPLLGYDPLAGDSVMGATKLSKKKTTTNNSSTNTGWGLPGTSLPGNTGTTSTDKPVDPIGEAIKKNPGYQSPAQIMGNGTAVVNPETAVDLKPTNEPVAVTVPQSVFTPDKTITDTMEKMRQAQIDAAIGNLKSRYQSTVGDINQKVQQIQPQYDTKRLQEQSQTALQAKNFAEYLAGRGQTTSGYGNQAEITRNLGLQQNIGALNQAQLQEENYYKNLQDQAQTSLNRDAAAAEAGANTTYMDNFMKYLTQQETLKKQSDLETAIKNAELKQRQQESIQNSWDTQQKLKAEAEQNLTTNQTKKDTEGAKLAAEAIQNQIKNTGYIEPQYDGVPVSKITFDSKIESALAPYQNNYAAAAQKFGQKEIYTVPQEMQGLLNVQIPQNIMEQLSEYGNNFAQAANDFRAQGNVEMANWAKVASAQKMASDPQLLEKWGVKVANPDYNPQLAQAAQVMSQRKMFQNPQLLQQYGNQYLSQEGMKNYFENQKNAIQTVGLQLDNLTNQTKLQYLQPQLAAQLIKDQEAVRKAQIENRYLEPQLVADINGRVAQAQAVIMNANTNVYQAQTGRIKANADITQAANNYALNVAKTNQSQGNTEWNQDKSLIDGYVKAIDEQYVTTKSQKQLDANGNEIAGGGTTTTKSYDKAGIDKATQDAVLNGEDAGVINKVRLRYGLPALKKQ